MPVPLIAAAGAAVGRFAAVGAARSAAAGGGASFGGRALQYAGVRSALHHEKPAQEQRPTMSQDSVAAAQFGALQPNQFG